MKNFILSFVLFFFLLCFINLVYSDRDVQVNKAAAFRKLQAENKEENKKEEKVLENEESNKKEEVAENGEVGKTEETIVRKISQKLQNKQKAASKIIHDKLRTNQKGDDVDDYEESELRDVGESKSDYDTNEDQKARNPNQGVFSFPQDRPPRPNKFIIIQLLLDSIRSKLNAITTLLNTPNVSWFYPPLPSLPERRTSTSEEKVDKIIKNQLDEFLEELIQKIDSLGEIDNKNRFPPNRKQNEMNRILRILLNSLKEDLLTLTTLLEDFNETDSQVNIRLCDLPKVLCKILNDLLKSLVPNNRN